MMEYLTNIFTWIWENNWQLIAFFILMRYGKTIYQEFIFTPLAGGNHKIQIDELAKGVILFVFVLTSMLDAFRETEYRLFSDGFYLSLLTAVAIIAGIKHGINLLEYRNKSSNEPPH